MITLMTTTICSSAEKVTATVVDVGVAETETVVKADRKDVDRVGVKADLDLVVVREISNVMKWDVLQVLKALKVPAVDKADLAEDVKECRDHRLVDLAVRLAEDHNQDLVVVNKADLVAGVDQDARVDHVRPLEAEVHQLEAEVHQLEAEVHQLEAEVEADLVVAEVEVDLEEAEVGAEAVAHKFSLLLVSS